MRNRQVLALFSLLLVTLAIVCGVFWSVSPRTPFTYDESDYMYAGTRGFLPNYVDRGSLSMVQFVQKGRELARDRSLREDMSQYVRSIGDISFYRHYHGPVYAYWLALWQDLGVRSEAGYRATGLVLHGLTAIAIFWLFRRIFPDLPPIGAFVAAAVFAMNRTALVTAAFITQHVAFECLACLTLFATALFFQTGERRWWYITTVLLALAFATVEISAVLIGAVLLSLLWVRRAEGVKPLSRLIIEGTAAFLATLLLIWPMGLIHLNALKGYAYLAYMAIYRKTFSPISPLELWGFKLKTYPYEFVLPLLALVVLLIGLRQLKHRASVTPFLIYAIFFVGVTMFVTLPYTHYNGSLLASAAVLTGIAFAELWSRSGVTVRGVALAAVLASLVWMDARYYGDRIKENSVPSSTADVLAFLNSRHAASRTLFIPFVMVPPIHYYRSDTPTIGYNTDWTATRLAQEAAGVSGGAEVFCEERLARDLEAQATPGAVVHREPIGKLEETGETLYVVTFRRL